MHCFLHTCCSALLGANTHQHPIHYEWAGLKNDGGRNHLWEEESGKEWSLLSAGYILYQKKERRFFYPLGGWNFPQQSCVCICLDNSGPHQTCSFGSVTHYPILLFVYVCTAAKVVACGGGERKSCRKFYLIIVALAWSKLNLQPLSAKKA